MNRLIVVAIGPALFGLGCAGSSNGSSSGGPPDRAPCGGVVAESTGAVRLASTPASQPIAIAADATNVYWTTYGSDPSQPGLVLKVPVVGGTPTTLATARTARVIAVDAANVYWGDTECNFTGGICAIMKVPISGGAATTLAALQSMPVGIVVTSDAIYWADSGTGSGRIMSLPLTG
ncbi:MAG TPA: hypothetical protein VMI75_05855, partial [Polyangiaceae bacterium]|nr:hypothetical protein [Polyangiaceae bacterium]